jgi:hypothetical protein
MVPQVAKQYRAFTAFPLATYGAPPQPSLSPAFPTPSSTCLTSAPRLPPAAPHLLLILPLPLLTAPPSPTRPSAAPGCSRCALHWGAACLACNCPSLTPPRQSSPLPQAPPLPHSPAARLPTLLHLPSQALSPPSTRPTMYAGTWLGMDQMGHVGGIRRRRAFQHR